MEANRKRQGFMKAKLVMSFYRTTKPKPSQSGANSGAFIANPRDHLVPQPKQKVALSTSSVGFIINQDQVTPQAPKQARVSFALPYDSHNVGRDSYGKFDNPYGIAGDEGVDLKAATYISCVQERFRLERMNSERKNSCEVPQDIRSDRLITEY